MDRLEFEVVLGTLKKVELKSGVQLTIIIFILSVTLAGFFESRGNDPYDSLYVILATLLILPLLLSISGTRQIDQHHFIKSLREEEVSDFLLRELQNDLLVKERAFRGARNISRVIVVAIVLIVAAESLDEIIFTHFSTVTGGSQK